MLIIILPGNFRPEREYIIHIFMNEFLGIEYRIDFSDVGQYEIVLPNGNVLRIRDCFFHNFNDRDDYLKPENIPSQIKFAKNEFTEEQDIPVIYGDISFPKHQSGGRESCLDCPIDIFASAFFMLTRWEEYVNKTRDEHNRFPAGESLAYKNNFLHRPVVNEYAEMLWNMLRALGYEGGRRDRKFKVFFTHDVDHIIKWNNVFSIIKTAGGDILRRRDIFLAARNLTDYLHCSCGKTEDPYNTFEWLMNLSESVNTRSSFYFMSTVIPHSDNRYCIYDSRVKELLHKIKNRGHYIGLHGSYPSFEDCSLLKKEKEQLEETAGIEVTEGRQHYLRIEFPGTWDAWDKAGLKIDSSAGYSDYEGFRCGTGDVFSCFNFLSGKRLNLKERPLVIMEGTLKNYRNLSAEESQKIILNYLSKGEHYKMPITILFHNSSFDANWKGWKDLYIRLIEILKTNNDYFA